MRTGEMAGLSARHDVIVVGSGVAGLRAAIEAAEGGLAVALLAKDTALDSSTDLAQGGVAVALSDEDQVGLHYRDTLAAGDGLCDEKAVGVLVGEGPRYIGELIEWGAQFDREGTRLAFTREAAHSASRVLHAQGDSTGREILRTLWRKASALGRITFLPHTYSVDLIVETGRCVGVETLDETTRATRPLASGSVVLASGGAGQIYLETTNPPQATGDGIAIAWRAGAVLRDMEFVQFHPTSLHVEGAPRFLLSEALRGEGGQLKTANGRRFTLDVDPRGELAPRDIVARAIVAELMRSGDDRVWLDMTHLERTYLERRFPRIFATCLRYGMDMSRDLVPVAPAAHYLMGGVATDLWGRSSVPGLYAAGEVACTGVHGANRLASNSLLEGLVFGARAGRAVVEDRLGRGSSGRPAAGAHRDGRESTSERAVTCEEGMARGLIAEVKRQAWRGLGIVRDEASMVATLAALEKVVGAMEPAAPAGTARPRLRPSRLGLEAGNMAAVASIIARSAMARRESRGAHFRSDFPARDDDRFGRPSFIERGMARSEIRSGSPATPAPPADVRRTGRRTPCGC